MSTTMIATRLNRQCEGESRSSLGLDTHRGVFNSKVLWEYPGVVKARVGKPWRAQTLQYVSSWIGLGA
jgi:hypothetical protein